MFLLWRVAKLAFKLALVLVIVLAGFVGWALLWPAPRIDAMRCRSHHDGCVAASGRVLYHTAFGRGHRAHLVLISSSSYTLPGVVLAEFPAQLTHAPAGLGFGDWVSIAGARNVGSHHEDEIHILRIATTRTRIRCGSDNGRHLCTKTAERPGG